MTECKPSREFEAYFGLADEIDGGLTLDDLDEGAQLLAKEAAAALYLPWPPQLAEAEEAWLDIRSGRRADMPTTCQWFALCDNVATTTQAHPILGEVPICARCATVYRDLGGAS